MKTTTFPNEGTHVNMIGAPCYRHNLHNTARYEFDVTDDRFFFSFLLFLVNQKVGGTVGDIESSVFLEALRQFQFRVGRKRMSLVHVTLVPVLGSVGEQKTKPTQQTVRELRSVGLHPDVICCRRLVVDKSRHFIFYPHRAAAVYLVERCVADCFEVWERGGGRSFCGKWKMIAFRRECSFPKLPFAYMESPNHLISPPPLPSFFPKPPPMSFVTRLLADGDLLLRPLMAGLRDPHEEDLLRAWEGGYHRFTRVCPVRRHGNGLHLKAWQK